MDTFIDKNVLITGASGGIGNAVFRRFLDAPEVLDSHANIAIFIKDEDRLASSL